MLGLKARDIVTGFEGVIVGRTEWMTGCATVGLAPGLDKDGKVPDATWFDETRVELLATVSAFEPLPPLPERLGLALAAAARRLNDSQQDAEERLREIAAERAEPPITREPSRRAGPVHGGPQETPQQAEQ